jgi:hypothetical protein
MGMVIVVGFAFLPPDPSPSWQVYDALPDPIGWLLVLSGTFALARTDDAFASSRWLAALAAVVSVPMWFPQVNHQLDPSGEWFASLPQIAFCLFLAREIAVSAARLSPPDGYVAKRFGLLVWGFALLGVLPILALGAGLQQLKNPTELVAWVVNVMFIYLVFRVHRHEWLGGPGPLLIHPRPQPEKRKGRPPSS